MSGHENSVAEETVHAYVDGFLEGPETEAFERRLHDEPALAARVADYQRQNAALQALGEALLHSAPAPTGGRRRPSLSWPGRRWRLAAVAAAAGLLLVGGLSGWMLRGALLPSPPALAFVAGAAGAHVVFVGERRHPVEVGPDEEAHLVRWLSKKLGTKLVAPNLRPHGFELVGGRLLSVAANPTALLMYQNAGKTRVTLYVGPTRDESTPAAFKFRQREGLSTFYWVEGAFGYALSGQLERHALLNLAEQVYQQLPRP